MLPPPVVADSNVIISALYLPGNPRRVLELAHRGEITLYLSPFILREVTSALAGPKFDWEPERIVTALLALPARIIIPGPPRLQVAPDPADNRILECAIAAGADYLVTGDRELLGVASYQHVRILTPAAFLAARPPSSSQP